MLGMRFKSNSFVVCESKITSTQSNGYPWWGLRGKAGSNIQKEAMITYLYVIRSGDKDNNPIKIGIAKNVDGRLKELQIGNPQQLFVLYKIPMKSRSHAYMVEARLHRQLNKYKIRGEWFKARSIYKLKFKDLIESIPHEKLFNEDDLEMVIKANEMI